MGHGLDEAWTLVIKSNRFLDAAAADDDGPFTLAVLIGPPTVAVLIGLAQWLVVRRYIPCGACWIVATALGVSAYLDIQFLFDEVSRQTALLQTAAAGLAFGVPQWFVLRRDFGRAGWWMVATTVAILAASPFGFGPWWYGIVEWIIDRPYFDAPSDAVAFAVDVVATILLSPICAYFVFGLLTGPVLLWILGKRAGSPKEDSSEHRSNAAQPPSVSSRPRMWVRWTVLTTLGGIGVTAWLAMNLLLAALLDSQYLYYLLQAGAGAALGWTQWKLLQRVTAIGPRAAWIWATLIGVALAIDIGFGVADWLSPTDQEESTILLALLTIASGLAAGLTIGSLQWLVLKKSGVGATPWLAASALGSIFGTAAYVMTPVPGFLSHFPVAMLPVWAACYGAATGVPLSALLGRRL
jgi:hypothetical protein